MTEPDPRGSGAYVDPVPAFTALTGVPPEIADDLDPALLNFETWVGDEVSSRSAMQYVTLASGGATFNVAFPVPDPADTVTRGIFEAVLIANPIAPHGGLRRQEQQVIAIDGFGAVPKTFFAHRFRMQSLVPDGANYEMNAGGLARYTATTTNNYTDGVFLFYDRTVGIASWVARCARGGVPVDIDLNRPWDNAFHTLGFLHEGSNVQAFLDGVVVGSYGGAEIQPLLGGVGPVAFHILAGIAGLNNGAIQSDWVAWGPSE